MSKHNPQLKQKTVSNPIQKQSKHEKPLVNTKKYLQFVNNRLFRLTVSFLLVFVLYFTIGSKLQLSKVAQFGFDQWDYQSLAVNFAKGHGLDKFGCIENFEEYKFGRFDEYYDGRMNDFINAAGHQNFYRTPGYPVYLGLIYKTFGVNPYIANLISLWLLIICTATLPIIGFHFWKEKGFVGGIISSFFALNFHLRYVDGIATENLITISFYLLLLAFILYDKKKNIFTAAILGLVMTIGMLVKGIFIFIPLLVIAYFIYRFFKSKNKTILIHALVIGASSFISLLPWSLYASKSTNSVVILSKQSGNTLLDGNNEFAKGGWTPEWISDKNSFYNNDGMQDKPAIIRLINFYKHHPKLLPELLAKKMIYGFVPFIFLWFFIATLFIESVLYYLIRYLKSEKVILPFLILIAIPIYILVINLWNFNYQVFYDSIAKHLYLLLILSIVPFILNYFKNKSDKTNQFKTFSTPAFFILILLNFVFITCILFGDIVFKENRFVGVINFMFIILSVQYMIEYYSFIFNKIRKV